MPLLRLTNISIAFGAHELLDRADFQLDAGERVGLLGRNGEGKSTLMKIIAGQIQADHGEIWRQPGLRLAWLEQAPDLPADATLAVADAVKLPVLNLSAASDRLRQQDCRPRLYHVTPSERMRADALAQTLVSRKWMQVLLLTGPTPADAERAAVVQAALKRYGLKVTASKPFKLSGDPRERDLANPLLLTQGGHDVVWVVDADGEFARTLPYRTATPRPVVGDAGLVAVAWHAQFERYGAPQVSRRFAREAKRPISAPDWTAWLAGKALAAAVVAAPKGPAAAVHKALAEGEVDGSQGVPMSFRPWDGQLRQPLLLTDGQGVIGSAPVEGILHPRNNLDTVGADAPEKLCKVAR